MPGMTVTPADKKVAMNYARGCGTQPEVTNLPLTNRSIFARAGSAIIGVDGGSMTVYVAKTSGNGYSTGDIFERDVMMIPRVTADHRCGSLMLKGAVQP